jgi:protease I
VLAVRRATCYFAIRDDVANAGAEYVDEEVVVDGPLVASRTPADLPAFTRGLLAKL